MFIPPFLSRAQCIFRLSYVLRSMKYHTHRNRIPIGSDQIKASDTQPGFSSPPSFSFSMAGNAGTDFSFSEVRFALHFSILDFLLHPPAKRTKGGERGKIWFLPLSCPLEQKDFLSSRNGATPDTKLNFPSSYMPCSLINRRTESKRRYF